MFLESGCHELTVDLHHDDRRRRTGNQGQSAFADIQIVILDILIMKGKEVIILVSIHEMQNILKMQDIGLWCVSGMPGRNGMGRCDVYISGANLICSSQPCHINMSCMA